MSRASRPLTVDGVTKKVSEWARESPVLARVIHRRIRRGWRPHDAVFRPSRTDLIPEGARSEYRSWQQAHYRCRHHERYVEIKVCDRWSDKVMGFLNFLEDMGRKPTPSHSIDRVDGSKDYSPENCRWATSVEQNRNKSNNAYLTAFGKTRFLIDWAADLGISHQAINHRLRVGWSVEDVVSIPAHGKRD